MRFFWPALRMRLVTLQHMNPWPLTEPHPGHRRRGLDSQPSHLCGTSLVAMPLGTPALGITLSAEVDGQLNSSFVFFVSCVLTVKKGLDAIWG